MHVVKIDGDVILAARFVCHLPSARFFSESLMRLIADSFISFSSGPEPVLCETKPPFAILALVSGRAQLAPTLSVRYL